MFRLRSGNPLKCVATASGRHRAAAIENIDRFVVRCHSSIRRSRRPANADAAPTLIKMTIDDLEDPQHRHCFRTDPGAGAPELFFVDGNGPLSVERVPRPAHEFLFRARNEQFCGAGQIASGHCAKARDVLDGRDPGFPRHLDIEGIERLLKMRSPALSTRECEVCARAVAGKTIEGTSLDLISRERASSPIGSAPIKSSAFRAPTSWSRF